VFSVTDLKQFVYCPRVFYYQQCLPAVRPMTDKMHAGIAAHDDEVTREHRRSLQAYGIQEAERQFDVRLVDEGVGLSGRLDLVLLDPDGERGAAVPVDYKLTRERGANIEWQLVAYALLLEACWGKRVERGFYYHIPLRRAESVRLTKSLKQRVRGALAQMRVIAETEQIPLPVRERGKCVDCEFRRFCNDV
jgi:CRISPR-associated exonuclease Cas4